MNKLLLLLAFLLSFKHFAQSSDFKHISFEKADAVAKQLKGASLHDLPVLAHKLTSQLNTDVEKFRAIYTWVCLNIRNDYGNHVLNLKKRKKFQHDSIALNHWNDQFKEKALKNLVKRKRTICTGYAYLLQELAAFAGLNCKMVHGYGRTVSTNVGELSIPNHSWNVIWLNNKWYLSDPTWSSGFFHFDEGRFVPEYNDGYFLADPELFVKSHYPLDTKLVLTNNTITTKDFLNGPLVYGNTFKYKIMPLEPVKLKTELARDHNLEFKFKVPNNLNTEDIVLVIDSGSGQKSIKTFLLNQDKSVLKFEHIFNRRGLFDVYLKVKGDVVSTHTVKVTR